MTAWEIEGPDRRVYYVNDVYEDEKRGVDMVDLVLKSNFTAHSDSTVQYVQQCVCVSVCVCVGKIGFMCVCVFL